MAVRVSGRAVVLLLLTFGAPAGLAAAEGPGDGRAAVVSPDGSVVPPTARTARSKSTAKPVQPGTPPPVARTVPHSARAPIVTSRNLEPDSETPADSGRADRPGTFGRQPVKLPGAFLHKNVVAPHSAPDLKLGSDGKTTLGVFGDANRIDRTDARNSTTKPITDVGAGLTLQYKFGQ